MTLLTTSIMIAAIMYVAYNVAALTLFGIPHSLSMTYYLWKEQYDKGYLFCFMMYIVVALMMPAWITMSEGSDFQFLAFLAPASLLFVATAPAFLSGQLENRVHTIAAYMAAACSLLWVILVTPFWWVILIWGGFVALASIVTSSYRGCYIYWLETMAFLSTFCATITYSKIFEL